MSLKRKCPFGKAEKFEKRHGHATFESFLFTREERRENRPNTDILSCRVKKKNKKKKRVLLEGSAFKKLLN